MLTLLGGYMWLFVHRPFEVWPWLGDMHIERVFMLFAIGIWALGAAKYWSPNRLHWAFLGFVVAVLLSWLVSPYASAGEKAVENYLKLVVFYILLVTVVHDVRSLRYIALMYLAATGLYMLHSLWEYHNGRHTYKMGIVRMIGVDTENGDPNSFSATILYTLPMLYPFWKQATTVRTRLVVLAYLALGVVCIVLTGSRAAFAGAAVLAGLMVLTSTNRRRLVPLAVLATPLLWFAIPLELQNRFLSLVDPSLAPASARESAEGRQEGWRDGVRLWQQYPVCGVGPGAFMLGRGRMLDSHHLYGQVIGELGTVGALAFAGVLLAFARNWREARALYRYYWQDRQDEDAEFAYHLVTAITVTVLLMLFEGFAGHNLYRYTWLWFGGFEAVAVQCLLCTTNDPYDVESPAEGWDFGVSSRLPAHGGGSA